MPPVAMIFTRSTPWRARSRTAATAASVPSATPPRYQQCPPAAGERRTGRHDLRPQKAVGSGIDGGIGFGGGMFLIFLTQPQGEVSAVTEVANRGDSGMQSAGGVLAHTGQNGGVVIVDHLPLGVAVRVEDEMGMRVHQARQESGVPQVRHRHALRRVRAGEIDVRDPSVLGQHHDRTAMHRSAVEQARRAYGQTGIAHDCFAHCFSPR
ncbi:hypothetical protein GCM10020000_18920 [Streptomyces olivoverticillatus]